MPISVKCPACNQRLKAKESLAGRKVACPKCGEKLLIPEPEDDSAPYAVQPDPPIAVPVAISTRPKSNSSDDEDEEAPPEPPRRAKKKSASLAPLTMNEPPLWLRHLHWLLVLALLPLTFSLLQRDDRKDDILSRLDETIRKASPEEQRRISQTLERLDKDNGSIEDLFGVLPDQRFTGAFLPRKTWAHWGFALAATVLFMTFFVLLASKGSANPLHLLLVGLVTATVGIVVLLLFQIMADWSQGVWFTGRGLLIVIFYIVKLIGFSYRAALDPDNGFLLSFFGYTAGVGFCEEVVKALPLLLAYRLGLAQTWRGAFLWGLASGAGFGIAEGIMYSANYYNGIQGSGIYLVRFISCVALHALWTGSAGITLNQRQGLIQQDLTWYEFFIPLVVIVGVPTVLHGLYDTFLKKEMNALALGVAILSFLFLAFQISRLHVVDDEEAKADMLREYKRRREVRE